MILDMAALTHKGQVRAQNEDCLFYDVRKRVIMVCDGMGGHTGGHIASELAVQVVANALTSLRPTDWAQEDKVIETMKNAVFGANDHILSRARIDPSLFDMGTTIVALAFMKDRVITANVGDSRIYRICDANTIEQVSEDHSLVAERIRAGQLDPDAPEAKMLSNILTRALGMDRVTVDISVESLVAGDTYLLCSDGLSDLVSSADMARIVNNGEDLQQSCVDLIDLANQRGGHDNITVALAHVS
ncbi:MAG: serine/threonine-protein phosphatase [Planctomycetota bacterium]|nr:MAG: serine/threonine-protein phosphatase [Planctomycetota bacterium]